MDKRDQQPRTRHADQEVQTDASDHPQPILATAADRQSEIPLGHHNAHRLRSRRRRRHPRPAILQQTIPQSHWQQPQPLPRRQSGIPPQHSRRAIDQPRQPTSPYPRSSAMMTMMLGVSAAAKAAAEACRRGRSGCWALPQPWGNTNAISSAIAVFFIIYLIFKEGGSQISDG